jgi:hypothetical protein
MPRARLLALFGTLAVGTLLLGGPAGARVEAESGYSKAQTYSGALRYLRVDLGYEVLEKDPDAAYLVFRYLPPGQPKGATTGTVEVVDRGDNIRVFVRLPSMPEYHEVRRRPTPGATEAARRPLARMSDPQSLGAPVRPPGYRNHPGILRA